MGDPIPSGPAGSFGVPEALAELRRRGVLGPADDVACVPLQVDSTKAVVALDRGAGPELVLKLDRCSLVWAAAVFLETYHGLPFLPALRHVDPAYRFLVFDWASGATGRQLEAQGAIAAVDKAQTLLSLARGLLCRYVPADPALGPPGCWLHERYPGRSAVRSHTWQAFLARGLASRDDPVRPHLPPGTAALVQHLASAPWRRSGAPPHLLHGDCGAHNLLFLEGHLTAVIDPLPAVGEPIFDLAFAFVSWPGDLTLDAILPAAQALESAGRWCPPPRERHRLLIEEVLLALYVRLGTFAVWRRKDIPTYVAAWAHWTDLLRRA
ncbi:MAG TPA: phosphotransferase [Chloroflexota bacterium]|nr:phosphotransferase [Chloroflexota bacterium]